jgi:ribosome maturation factor RimP
LANLNVPERIERSIAPSLEAMGYEVVRVQLSGKGGQLTLQVMAEPRGGGDMTVEKCADISRAISALLDVEDPISGAYTLEVSSPGIDRPLVRPRDYERFAGYEAKIETNRLVDGRKRFRGRLGGVTEDGVRIALEQQETEVPFDAIHRAKLVMTDELLAEAAKAQEH